MKPPTDRQDGLHSGGKQISQVQQWVCWGKKDALKGPPPFQSAIIFLMCGRYRLSRRKQLVEEYFDCVSDEPDWAPRYNIAPTQPVPVIRQNPKEPIRKLSLMRWGLIPSWAKDSSIAAQMINARSETAAAKPAFRDPLASRRCLVPADGFYEWLRSGKAKQPYCFEVNAGELFAFAGVWDRWKDPKIVASRRLELGVWSRVTVSPR